MPVRGAPSGGTEIPKTVTLFFLSRAFVSRRFAPCSTEASGCKMPQEANQRTGFTGLGRISVCQLLLKNYLGRCIKPKIPGRALAGSLQGF